MTGADGAVAVTVVGPRRSADLLVALDAPSGRCADAAAAELGETSPGPWGLAEVGQPPLPSTATLRAAGVLDGGYLQLVDLGRPGDRRAVPGAAQLDVDRRAGPALDRFRSADPLSGARS